MSKGPIPPEFWFYIMYKSLVGISMVQMSSALTTISTSDLVLDKEIYPRNAIDHRRVDMFAENMRDGFTFEPIDVEVHPEERGKYRILDGVHRYKPINPLVQMR